MSGFAKCVIWLLALALLAHPLGQALPRRWFDGERFPYRCYKWENRDGSIPASAWSAGKHWCRI